MGRTGDEHDELAVALMKNVKPLAGRAALQGWAAQLRLRQNVGLLEIVRRHGDAPGGGAGVEGGDLRGVAAKRERKLRRRLREELRSSSGGPEAAHPDENGGAP